MPSSTTRSMSPSDQRRLTFLLRPQKHQPGQAGGAPQLRRNGMMLAADRRSRGYTRGAMGGKFLAVEASHPGTTVKSQRPPTATSRSRSCRSPT